MSLRRFFPENLLVVNRHRTNSDPNIRQTTAKDLHFVAGGVCRREAALRQRGIQREGRIFQITATGKEVFGTGGDMQQVTQVTRHRQHRGSRQVLNNRNRRDP